jgi:serpin B
MGVKNEEYLISLPMSIKKKREREQERKNAHVYCVITIICSLLHSNMPSIDRLLYQFLLFVILLHINNAAHSKTVEKDLSKSILDFTVGFSRHHSSSDVAGRRNLVWSPLSLYQAMLMVGEGADGSTFNELGHITHLKTKEAYREWSSNFLNDAKKNVKENRQYNISLNVANRLYADDDFDLADEFNKNLEKYYQSQLELIDFSQAEKSAEKINKWISNQTNNIINNVLKPKDINSLTRLMLVNALHFKAPWFKPFDSDLSTKENFTLNTGRLIELQTMHLTSHFPYYYDKKHKSQWINLPYKGNNRYVLTLVLPDKDTELRVLEKRLLRNSKVLSSIFHALDNRTNVNVRVQLSLPKFRIESSLDFVQHFKQYYNVKIPFDGDKADFSLMSSTRERDLFISKIIHKAVIDVDEAGTEAAAVTVIQMLSRSGMFLHEDPIQLTFSRPFLFYLRDINIKVPLFVGRFTGMSMP